VGNGRYFPNASMISLTRATPVRAIVVFVDALDLAEIRFEGWSRRQPRFAGAMGRSDVVQHK
jgi:hypothetical protein